MGKDKSDTPHKRREAQHVTNKRHYRRETPKAGQVSLSATALLVKPESRLGVAGTWHHCAAVCALGRARAHSVIHPKLAELDWSKARTARFTIHHTRPPFTHDRQHKHTKHDPACLTQPRKRGPVLHS
jgi:hypothetical protein